MFPCWTTRPRHEQELFLSPNKVQAPKPSWGKVDIGFTFLPQVIAFDVVPYLALPLISRLQWHDTVRGVIFPNTIHQLLIMLTSLKLATFWIVILAVNVDAQSTTTSAPAPTSTPACITSCIQSSLSPDSCTNAWVAIQAVRPQAIIYKCTFLAPIMHVSAPTPSSM